MGIIIDIAPKDNVEGRAIIRMLGRFAKEAKDRYAKEMVGTT